MAHSNTINKFSYNDKERGIKFEYSSINCLKAFGAFLVVCIHCKCPWYFDPLLRTAVPLFFTISGFLLFSNERDETLERCKKALKKIFWITIYANIFYYICLYFPYDLFPIQNKKSLIEFILWGNKLGFHLWYLNAYMEVLLIMIIALKFNLLKYVWLLIPVCIIGEYCSMSFKNQDTNWVLNFIPLRNFFSFGIPFFGIGCLLKMNLTKCLKIFHFPIILTITILILSIIEMGILYYFGILSREWRFFTTYFLVPCIMLCALKYPLFGENSIVELIGKKYSLYIYIFHVFIRNLFYKLNERFLNLPSYTFPFIVFILTIIFIIIWKKSSSKFFVNKTYRFNI